MGEKEIKDKLIEKLKSVPKTEEDIVYILSRIRKILEINSHPENYSILNFYCNLTLHAKLTRAPKVIIDKLKKIHKGEDKQIDFEFTSKDFHDQLDSFCKENDFDSFYHIQYEDLKQFNNLLLDIWSYTPIRIEYVEAFSITLERDDNGKIIVSAKPAK